jgi:hypothetical protein
LVVKSTGIKSAIKLYIINVGIFEWWY